MFSFFLRNVSNFWEKENNLIDIFSPFGLKFVLLFRRLFKRFYTVELLVKFNSIKRVWYEWNNNLIGLIAEILCGSLFKICLRLNNWGFIWDIRWFIFLGFLLDRWRVSTALMYNWYYFNLVKYRVSIQPLIR